MLLVGFIRFMIDRGSVTLDFVYEDSPFDAILALARRDRGY